MKFRHLLPLVAGASMLAAAAPEEKVQPAVIPPETNFVVARIYAEPTAWAATIKIDGKKMVALGNKSFSATRLSPGTHRVSMTWPLLSGQGSDETMVNVPEAGLVYVFVGGISRYDGSAYHTGSLLAVVDGARATPVLEGMKAKPSKL